MYTWSTCPIAPTIRMKRRGWKNISGAEPEEK